MQIHVIEELLMCSGILPLLCHSMRRPWRAKAFMCDASYTGREVVEATSPASVACRAGRVNERWRGKAGREPDSLRAEYLAECLAEIWGLGSPLYDTIGVVTPEDMMVGPDLLHADNRVVGCELWHRVASIFVLEAKSIARCLKHMWRSVSNFGHRP